MVTLVLCDESDPSGPWLAAGLRRSGHDIVLAGARELTTALRTEYRLRDDGDHLTLRLSRERELRSEEVTAVVNRLRDIPRPVTPGVPSADLDYAQEELRAITLAWLSGLASTGIPMIGRPSPGGLSGAWRSRAEWAVIAASAGVDHAPVRFADDGLPEASRLSWALVVCGAVYGHVDPELHPGLLRLAGLADTEVLGAALDNRARLVIAEHLPDLRPSGTAGLARLEEALAAPVVTVVS